MRMLLTSAAIKNASIRDALVELLGKPIAESSALCFPPRRTPTGRYWPGMEVHRRREPRTPMCELGWITLRVLELTALPSIDEENWLPVV